MYERCLQIRERAYGIDSEQLEQCILRLAKVCKALGQSEKADSLYKRCLKIIVSKSLERDPEKDNWGLISLAKEFEEDGRYQEAELLYKRSLRLMQDSKRSPLEIATSSLFLANVYVAERKNAEAKGLFESCVKTREQILGAKNLQVAIPLHGLVTACIALGMTAEAESSAKRALDINEQVLGPDHQTVALSLLELGILYKSLGKFEQAEPLLKRSLRIMEHHENIDLTVALENLGSLYRSQKKYAQAEPLLEKALHLQEKYLGPNHQAVAWTLYGLANLHFDQGKFDEVEPLLLRALKIMERQVPSSLAVTTILSGLSNYYSVRCKHDLAERFCRRAIQINDKALGPDHPDSAWTVLSLAHIYTVQGKYLEAEPLYKRSLRLSSGLAHPKNFGTQLEKEAFILRIRNRTTQAAVLEAKAKALKEKEP